MKKWYMLFMVVVFLFTISACDVSTDQREYPINTEITEVTIEETEATVRVLDSIEYWDIVQEEIIFMLNQNNLYVSTIDSAYPAIIYEVEPGKQTDDGKIVAAGLSQEQYEELYQHIKVELQIILDKYELAEPKSAFHACDSIVGISFYNWFIDKNKVADNVESLWVASYQLDLLEYYHKYEEDAFVIMEGFSENVWSKYVVYNS